MQVPLEYKRKTSPTLPYTTLQWCTVQLGSPPGILCSEVHDLCRCLAPLIEKDDLIDTSMFEVAEEMAKTSPSPAEEGRSLVEEPEC